MLRRTQNSSWNNVNEPSSGPPAWMEAAMGGGDGRGPGDALSAVDRFEGVAIARRCWRGRTTTTDDVIMHISWLHVLLMSDRLFHRMTRGHVASCYRLAAVPPTHSPVHPLASIPHSSEACSAIVLSPFLPALRTPNFLPIYPPLNPFSSTVFFPLLR